MAKKLNERETENIVRQHFQKDKLFSSITLEEQLSNIPKIDKLLKYASKKGGGKGKPEFIITTDDEKKLLIVVECKADILKHESDKRDRYSEYAVDGALLYSSFLSKEYDVLSLAVSGIEKDNLRVSYFIQRKGKGSSERVFGNRLISIEDTFAGLRQDREKRNEKYENLLNYSQILNAQLHTLKIKEDKRSLLVSGVLIALGNKDFYRSYATIPSNNILANALVDTIKKCLKDESLQSDKIDRIMDNYNFIKNYPSLVGKDSGLILKELVDDIDENINSYVRTYKYYDVLGQFYIEFLRYSNSDKGLGIVLTPPHITEFFTDIVDIKADDVVLDTCAGTAGFLVSAMKKMIAKSGGDSCRQTNIKQNQLYGVEYQQEIYPLAVSNMFLHGDGKSNIINGDCFDNDVIREIKSKKPTIGFLNPPYKRPKDSGGTEELEFILNSLHCLEKHGQCVAIVPMSCALAQTGKRLRLKDELLSKHTLKAVFSMPDELFYNSKVGTNTCIMVFEAHIPHPERLKTFFGYFKHDGLSKRKEKGRFDYSKKWNGIKEEWLNLYTNNETKDGLSVLKKVCSRDEWCAEAYMQTNYSLLNEASFINTSLQYLTFLFRNKLSDNVSFTKYKDIGMNINVEAWDYFRLNSLFSIKGSKTTSILDLEEKGSGSYPYITTQATNNGVGGFYNFYTETGNCLTVDSAVIGYCSYQRDNFSASDHVEKLIPEFKMNKYIAIFLTTILNLEQYRYNYGRKCSQTRMREISIKLPTKNSQPDWKFMEDYIKSQPYSNDL